MAIDKIDVTKGITGTLPVANGGTGLTSGFVNGGGLTAASQWRLTTTFTGDANPISSNFEVVDTDGYGSLGSAMTESSGIFTFPSTGYWYVSFKWYGSTGGAAQIYTSSSIEVTINNSSYAPASYGDANLYFEGSGSAFS